ncbi:DUF4271 domain-containing protein [Wenyingzhuangia fucanilytica]
MPLIIVFLMCMVDLLRTKLLFKSLFSNQYFYKYPHDSVNTLSLYQVLVFLYMSVVLALFLMFLLCDKTYIYQQFFEAFRSAFYISSSFFIVKYLVSEFLYQFSNKKLHFKQMLILETSYLTVVLLVVFLLLSCVFLHLDYYDSLRNILLIIALLTYFIRFIVLVLNNKNLLSGKVLHIILYLCTLEIVPFVYLFKSYIE